MSKLNDLNLWRVFLNLARTRNFSYTAAEFGVDVSTISRILTTLEKALGRSLFVRSTRPLTLTELGELSERLMRPLVERQLEVVEQLRALNSNMQGTIRLSTSYGVATEILGPILLKFQSQYPDVHFKVVGGGGIKELISRTADVVCSSGRGATADMVLLSRGYNFYVPIASPEYLKTHPMPQHPRDLKQHTVFAFDGATRSPTQFLCKGEEKAPIDVSRAIVMSNILAIRENVLKGRGICVDMPVFLCADDIVQGRLVPVLSGWYRSPVEIFVIASRETWNSKIHRIFMCWLQRELATFFNTKRKLIEPFWTEPPQPEESAATFTSEELGRMALEASNTGFSKD